MLETLKALTGKPYTWYLTELTRQEDALLDMKEGVIDPVRKFMSGPQKGIFDNARQFVQAQEPNFAYVEGEEPSQVIAVLADPACFKGNRMQQVKTLVDKLQAKVAAQIDAEIAKARNSVDALKSRLCGMPEFTALPSEQQAQIIKPFDDCVASIEQQKLIAVIRDTMGRFEETEYQALLTQLSDQWPVASGQQETGSAARVNAVNEPVVVSNQQAIFKNLKSIAVSFDKAWLADETDVDRYLDAMREALLAEIRRGRKIQM